MICWEGGYVKRTLRPLIYRAYQDYGFAYCFAYSIFDNGMGEPEAYSPVAVSDIGTGIDIEVEPSEETEKKPAGFVEDFKEFVRYNLFSSEPESYTAEAVGTIKQLIKRPDGDNENADVPNYIFVQLESFFDPLTLTDFEIVGDPIPVFRGLMEKYTSGKLYVPTVSGGTANTEFEVLTGCNLDFFGVGEIPFYTVAKNGVIESLATDLKTLGLSTTMLHNYTGSFYDRNIGGAVFAVHHGHFYVVRAPQAVRDDHIAARGHAVEAVDLGVLQMVYRVFAAAGIESVAVRQEGLAAQLLDDIRHGLYIIGSEIGEVAQLSEVHFDGHEFSVKIDAADARRADQLLKFCALAHAYTRAKVRKIHFCLFHPSASSYDNMYVRAVKAS